MDFQRSLSQIVLQNAFLSSGSLCLRLWKPSYDSAQLWIQRRMDKHNAWTRFLRLCWGATLKIIWILGPSTSHSRICLQLCKTFCYGKVAILTRYGRNRYSPISIVICSAKSQVNDTTTLLKSLHAAWADARDCLSFAQAQQAKFQNEYRKSRDFNPGDLFLIQRNPMIQNDSFKSNPKILPWLTDWSCHLEVGCTQSCMLDGYDRTVLLCLVHLITRRTL